MPLRTKHSGLARAVRFSAIAGAASLLAGCNFVVMSPSGDIAQQQSELIIYATLLMLIVILPVIALTIFFAIHYRSSNTKARYEPEWDHSISLEIVIWTVPLAIIILLAGLTWVATHRLNPYDPLQRISADQPVEEGVEPLRVQVVAMDWKWLFIYPDYGIATVNEAAAIVDRPIEFKITSSTVMNSFYVPALAGMIYAMAGMETELNAVFNEEGRYNGFSANYSGAGFSEMRFTFDAFDEDEFERWVETVKADAPPLDRDTFIALDQPSIDHPVTYYSGVEEGLWDLVVNMCTDRDELCRDDMMMVDALGGGGLEGLERRLAFAGICSADDALALFSLIRPSLLERAPDIYAAMTLLPDVADGPKTPATEQTIQ